MNKLPKVCPDDKVIFLYQTIKREWSIFLVDFLSKGCSTNEYFPYMQYTLKNIKIKVPTYRNAIQIVKKYFVVEKLNKNLIGYEWNRSSDVQWFKVIKDK